MSDALSERIFEVLGDYNSPRILAALCEAERSQAALVRDLGIAQSIVSRSLKNLRLVGLVVADSSRGMLRVRALHEVNAFLLAADRLAEAVIRFEGHAQSRKSDATRRGAIQAANDRTVAGEDAHAGA